MADPALLAVDNLTAGYGPTRVLFGLSMRIGKGETVAVVGRNGAGRSTLLKALAGRIDRAGGISLDGIDLTRQRAFQIARRGIAYIPENREIFGDLTVMENLTLGLPVGDTAPGGMPWSMAESFSLFPRLRERAATPAGALSGGEQQMLAFARAMMGCPRLLLVDEPTEGLSPMMVRTIADAMGDLQRRGLSILLVEQKLDIALELASRVYVLGRGEIVFEGSPAELDRADDVRRTWIAV